jgi:glycosyltransferase involved in cell wall biosynthesis
VIGATVILCVRNGAATIAQQLAASADQDYPQPWELLVVDNGSTDGTAGVVEQWRPRLPGLRLVSASDRAGLAYARNVGVREARGPIVAFCDADDVADPGWLSGLVAGAREAELVGGRLEFGLLNGERAREWRGVAEDRPSPPVGLGYLPYAVGASFAVRREVIEGVGGCDERFTACGDDLDLSWRIQRAGGRLIVREDAVMHYRLRSDLAGVMRQRYRYGRVEALLRRKFSDALPPVSPRARALSVLRLLARSWQLLGGAQRRGAWLVAASHLAGQLRGSVAYGVLA